MSNIRRETLARKWAESILGLEVVGKGAAAAAEIVMANTKPETMADVEWDNDKHRGVGVMTPQEANKKGPAKGGKPMSNLEKAAEVIDQWTKEGHELNSAVGSPHAIATRLAGAGLLAPDLPEPDECPPEVHKPGWYLGVSTDATYAAAFAGHVWVTGRTGWGHQYTPEQARAVACKLLAAANHAKGVENVD